MADQELNLILRLRDEATSQLKSVRGAVTAAAGVMAAAGLKAGADWDKATKTIVAGTGATGDKLKGLQKDYQAVARYGSNSATVVADLNTHLGLQGEELRKVAAGALKAGVDTNQFGGVAKQLGLDAAGAAELLDDLTVASQNTGVDVDTMTRTIGKSSARWLAAGGTMEGLTATVTAAADEFGPSGLRGAMSEILAEVDKGVIPSVASLRDQLGDTTGAVERTYQAGRTWRDVLKEQKDAAVAYLGPAGDMLAGVGSLGVGLTQVIPLIKGTRGAQAALNLVMRANPIGLVVTAVGLAAVAIYNWREEIMGFLDTAWGALKGAVESAKAWLSPLTSMFGGTADEVEHLSDELAGHSLTDALAAAARESEATKESEKRLKEETKALAEATREAEAAHEALVKSLQASEAGVFKQTNARLVEMAQHLEGIDKGFHNVVASGYPAFTRSLVSLQPTVKQNMAGVGDVGGGGFLSGFFDQLTGQGDQQGGLLGRMGGFMQTIQGGWQGIVTAGLNMVPIVGPLLATFGPALMKGIESLAGKVWGGIKGLFTGRGTKIINVHEDWLSENRETFEQIEGYTEEVQRNIANGWEQKNAETRAAFHLMGRDIGLTWKEADDKFVKFLDGVTSKNVDLVRDMLNEWNDWRDQTVSVVQGASDDIVGNSIWPDMIDAMEAKADELREYMRGVFRDICTAATDCAKAIGALTFGATGGSVSQAGSIGVSSDGGTSGTFKGQAYSFTAAERRNLPRWHPASTIEAGTSSQLGGTSGTFKGQSYSFTAAERKNLPSWHPASTKAIYGRQSGGPVSAGRPYMVGERGPETFVPSSSGSILPNGLTAEAIGEAVARALHRVPLSVPQSAVTDSVLRATPVRQALRGWS